MKAPKTLGAGNEPLVEAEESTCGAVALLSDGISKDASGRRGRQVGTFIRGCSRPEVIYIHDTSTLALFGRWGRG